MLISLSRFKHSLYGLGLSDVLGKFFFFGGLGLSTFWR